MKGQVPIDRGWAWMVMIGVFYANFILIGISKSFGIIFVELIRLFKVSVTEASLIVSLNFLVAAFATPVCILVAKIQTVRKVAMFGVFVGFLGYVLTSRLINITYFIIIHGICQGLSYACVYASGLFLLNQYFIKWRSTANGIGLCGGSLGTLAFPPLVEYLLETYGLSGTLLLQAGIFLNAGIAAMLYRPIETLKPRPAVERQVSRGGGVEGHVLNANHGISEDENIQIKEHPPQPEEIPLTNTSKTDTTNDPPSDTYHGTGINNDKKPSFLSKFIDINECKSYVTLLYTIVVTMATFGQMNFVYFLPAVVLEKGITGYQNAILISIIGLGDLVARVATGFLGDINVIRRYIIMAVACVVAGGVVLVIGYSEAFILLALECGVFGFFSGSMVASILPVMVDFVGLKALASNMALIIFVQAAGSGAGNILLGVLRDFTESYTIICVVCGLSLCISGVLLCLYPLVKRVDVRRKQTQEGQ